jgi:hypothetical protein
MLLEVPLSQQSSRTSIPGKSPVAQVQLAPHWPYGTQHSSTACGDTFANLTKQLIASFRQSPSLQPGCQGALLHCTAHKQHGTSMAPTTLTSRAIPSMQSPSCRGASCCATAAGQPLQAGPAQTAAAQPAAYSKCENSSEQRFSSNVVLGDVSRVLQPKQQQANLLQDTNNHSKLIWQKLS